MAFATHPPTQHFRLLLSEQLASKNLNPGDRGCLVNANKAKPETDALLRANPHLVHACLKLNS